MILTLIWGFVHAQCCFTHHYGMFALSSTGIGKPGSYLKQKELTFLTIYLIVTAGYKNVTA